MATNTNFPHDVAALDQSSLEEPKPVSAILLITIGTRMTELAPALAAHLAGVPDQVPWRLICIDTIPYDNVISRLVDSGWSERQAREALPRSHYLELRHPFTGAFDFDNPLNRPWLKIIFEPDLRRIARGRDVTGANGTPAIGAARLEATELEICAFVQRHAQELVRVRPETLALLDGLRVIEIGTGAGGTATGGALRLGALVRSVLPDGEVHFHVIDPAVYGGDERASANFYAMLCEMQNAHRYGAGVVFRDDRVFPAPFVSVTPILHTNGAVSLTPHAALMLEVSILSQQLRARTQMALNARRVDLTDVSPFNLDDNPLHVSQQTGVSIRTACADVHGYLVRRLVASALETRVQRFEAHLQSGSLSPEERERVRGVADEAKKQLKLSVPGLLGRLEPTPSPFNQLRNFIDHARATIANLPAEPVKAAMNDVPTQIRRVFANSQRDFEQRALLLAQDLPREILAFLDTALAGFAHLVVAALDLLVEELTTIAADAAKEADQQKKVRDSATSQFATALSAVQSAKGILGFWGTDEVTRDAGIKALDLAQTAALARAQQERHEYLKKALDGALSTGTPGNLTSLPAVVEVLRRNRVAFVTETRSRSRDLLRRLNEELDDQGTALDRRSPIFERTLVLDGVRREQLDSLAGSLAEQFADLTAITRFVGGAQDLKATMTELMPLLPAYADLDRPIADVVSGDPVKRALVLAVLRGLRPFTPLDRVVEEQQGFTNRRDKLLILEVPGGRDGYLGQLMLAESIVPDKNCVVDCPQDEIRLYFLRDGLGYASLSLVPYLRKRHDQYLSRPGAITPYTTADWHRMPSMEPPRVNLRFHTERLLVMAEAALPARVKQLSAGEFALVYDVDTGHNLTTREEELFPNFDALTLWVAKRVAIRKTLEAELRQMRNANPKAYGAALLAAWKRAEGAERHHLADALHEIGIDPKSTPPGARGPARAKTPATPSSRRTQR